MSRKRARRTPIRKSKQKNAGRRLCDTAFALDVMNQPDGSATISGHYFAPGKTPSDLDAQTLAVRLDREWFQSHPRRSHRIRRAIAGESPGVPPDCYVAVRQMQPGLRLRRHFATAAPLPQGEAPEHIAHAFYDVLDEYPGKVVPGHEFSQRIRAYALGGELEHPSHDKPPVRH
jgi:hypothetical protein